MSGYEGTHQDWLESQASDHVEREEFERERTPTGTRYVHGVGPVPLWEFEGWHDGRLQVGLFGLGAIRLRPQDAVAFAHAILSEVEIEEQAASQGCECELDWNCPLHQGGPTPIERINDAWASEQTEIDRQHGM